MARTKAVVRPPTLALEWGLVDGPRRPVDTDLALHQHSAYTAGLAWCGLEVHPLEPLREAPDACFVEDRAIVLGRRALITRSAVASRASEAASLASALGHWLDITWMKEGQLDGGDVLRVGRQLWVGQSARTDAAGAEALARWAAADGLEVIRVPVRGLHLKCVCSAPAAGVLLYAEGYGLEDLVPEDVRAVSVPSSEAYAANAVGANGRVLVPAGFPVTEERLSQAGLQVRSIDNSEFAKRDGSLTCLSILFG